MNKDKEVHGLMKLPEEAIIASLRVELGKANAYIAELEDSLKEALKCPPDLAKLMNDNSSLRGEIKKLRGRIDSDEVMRLRRTVSELVAENIKLKR